MPPPIEAEATGGGAARQWRPPAVGLALLVQAGNHLMDRQPALRLRLQPFAGRRVRFDVETFMGPIRHELRIGADGRLHPEPAQQADAVLRFRPSPAALIDWMGGGRTALQAHLAVDGDVMLAGALADVLRQIDWDVEEDLSLWLGDALAHRVGSTVRAVMEQGVDLARQAQQQWVERWSDPRDAGSVVTRPQWQQHATALQALRRRVDALDIRVPR